MGDAVGPLEGEAEGKAEGRLDGSAEGWGEGSAVGTAEGLADGERLGAGLGGKEMTRPLILAAAAGYQGSDAYTCTLGQVSCEGLGNVTDCGDPPDTVIAMSRIILSMVMVTVDHTFKGRAVAWSITVRLDAPFPEPICRM